MTVGRLHVVGEKYVDGLDGSSWSVLVGTVGRDPNSIAGGTIIFFLLVGKEEEVQV